MIQILVVAVGGGVLVSLLAGQRQPTLLDKLAPSTAASEPKAKQPPKAPSVTEPAAALTDLAGHIHASLAELDESYQTYVQTHLDPWLAGQWRNEQMLALTRGELRELGEDEKIANRSLPLGLGGMMLIGVARFTGWPLIPAVVGLGLYNASPVIREGWRIAVNERRFSLIHIMLFYLGFLWLGGNYFIGTIGIIFGSFCQKFALLTQTVTRNGLKNLLGEQPTKVWVIKDGLEVEIAFEQIRCGDLLVLTAGQPVPIDGVVIDGEAIVDQHHLTGESQPVERLIGDTVLAATLVLGGKIIVRVEKTGAETTAARISDVLNLTVENQQVRIADQLKDLEKYTWPMLAGGALGWLIRGPEAGVAMLGCNFMLSQAGFRLLTLLNGLGAGTERGILIKDGRALDRLPGIDTVVFDKTGTLTLERQQVCRIHLCADHDEIEVLMFAAAVEQRQDHPVAKAILVEAAERQIVLPSVEDIHYELGLGLRALVQGQDVRIGSERYLSMEDLKLPPKLQEASQAAHAKGNALVIVAIGGAVAGAIELAVALRPEAKATVDWLRHQGLALYILSGDQEAPTAYLAGVLGMDGYFANTLPDQKAERLKELQASGKQVCFIGDGINDAIALRQAEVSVSLRGATTIATDAAQVVLMDDDLSQFQVLWELAQSFDQSIADSISQLQKFSLLAAALVLTLPYGLVTIQILSIIQVFSGVKIAQRPLLRDRV
ncbi:MAG: heavy metal translocating P-type ATPase [Cyanobium sp.]